MPRRGIGRSRLTEGEPSELDERHFNRDIATAGIVQQVAVQAAELTSGHEASTTRATGRTDAVARTRGRRRAALRTEVVELEVGLAEGTDDAVLGGGTGINRQRHTGTAVDPVGEPIACAQIAIPGWRIVDATIERGVDAQITTQLDA